MAQVFVYRYVVSEQDIDYLGHASNIAYVRWVQDATVAHSEACGLSVDAYKRAGGIFVIRRNEVDYVRPAALGDELEIHTHVSGLTAAKATRQTEVIRTRDSALLARAQTIWGFVDFGTGRPIRVPHWVREAFGMLAPVREASEAARRRELPSPLATAQLS